MGKGRIEFRVAPNGMVYYQEDDSEEKRLTRFDHQIVDYIMSSIKVLFPGAYARLATLYKTGTTSPVIKDKEDFNVVQRFIRCNFGEHDMLTADIDADIINFEEVKCPLRGLCKDENIICKPQSVYKLSLAEKEVARLYLRGYTYTDIASVLGKSPQTIKVQLDSIKNKVGAKNCREIIKVMRVRNL